MSGQGPWATLVGLIVLFFGASGVFVQLQDALNTIWSVAPRPGRTIWVTIKDRILSFILVVVTGLLLLASLIASAVLAGMVHLLKASDIPGGMTAWQAR